MICNLIKAVLTKISTERTRKDITSARSQILNHKIFYGVAEAVKGIDKNTFAQSKDIIGKSLREDYSFIEQSHSREAISQDLRVHVDENLKLVSPPYVRTPTPKKFTLVLDLDETLLHYMEKPYSDLPMS